MRFVQGSEPSGSGGGGRGNGAADSRAGSQAVGQAFCALGGAAADIIAAAAEAAHAGSRAAVDEALQRGWPTPLLSAYFGAFSISLRQLTEQQQQQFSLLRWAWSTLVSAQEAELRQAGAVVLQQLQQLCELAPDSATDGCSSSGGGGDGSSRHAHSSQEQVVLLPQPAPALRVPRHAVPTVPPRWRR